MDVVKSSRGKDQLGYEGHLYRRDKGYPASINWRCVKDKCKGRLTTGVNYDDGGEDVLLTGEHSHGPDPAAIEVLVVKTAALTAAVETTRQPRRILQQVVGGIGEEAAARIGSGTNLKQSIRRKRQREDDHPREVQAARDLRIPPAYRTTADGDSFIIYDTEDDPTFNLDERVIMLGTNQTLSWLESHDNWFADGTFKISPAIFLQLFTIHVLFSSTTVPALFVLMTRKTQEMYRIVFQKIQDLRPQVRPTSLMSDFETGMRNAFKNVFPAAALGGCFFHLGQSIYRKVQSEQLTNLYKDDEKFRTFVKMMSALAFLPPGHVVGGFVALQDHADYTQNLDPIYNYFEDTYIGRPNRRGRQRPMFPIAEWNAFNRLEDGLPRTNNQVESWHLAFQGSVGHAHPTFFRLLDSIKREQGLQRAAYLGLVAGQQQTRHMKKYVRINRQLRLLLNDRENRPTVDLLRGISYNLTLNP